jgi:hypothetical protein
MWPFVGTAGLSGAFEQAGSALCTLGYLTPRFRPRGSIRLPRRPLRSGHGGPPDRLPPHALRRLQPARSARDVAGLPSRGAFLGSRTARPHPLRVGHRCLGGGRAARVI